MNMSIHDILAVVGSTYSSDGEDNWSDDEINWSDLDTEDELDTMEIGDLIIALRILYVIGICL